MYIIERHKLVNVGRRKFPLFVEHLGSNWLFNSLLEHEALVNYLNTNAGTRGKQKNVCRATDYVSIHSIEYTSKFLFNTYFLFFFKPRYQNLFFWVGQIFLQHILFALLAYVYISNHKQWSWQPVFSLKLVFSCRFGWLWPHGMQSCEQRQGELQPEWGLQWSSRYLF